MISSVFDQSDFRKLKRMELKISSSSPNLSDVKANSIEQLYKDESKPGIPKSEIASAQVSTLSVPISPAPPISGLISSDSQTSTPSKDLQSAESPKNAVSSNSLEVEALLSKLEIFKKENKPNEIIGLINEHPELSDNIQAQEFFIESLLKQSQVNTINVKRAADNLFQKDQKNALANLGMGYYYVYSKKPDLGKAISFLRTASSVKNPPEGASALYWKAVFKKWWLILLVFLAGLIAAGDFIRKKLAEKSALSKMGLPEPIDSIQGVLPEPIPEAFLPKIIKKVRSLFSRRSVVQEGQAIISELPTESAKKETQIEQNSPISQSSDAVKPQ
ncbi:hypothetical protein HYY75_07655 [bacterium]|nr:hypothetical protein [bacterium]